MESSEGPEARIWRGMERLAEAREEWYRAVREVSTRDLRWDIVSNPLSYFFLPLIIAAAADDFTDSIAIVFLLYYASLGSGEFSGIGDLEIVVVSIVSVGYFLS